MAERQPRTVGVAEATHSQENLSANNEAEQIADSLANLTRSYEQAMTLRGKLVTYEKLSARAQKKAQGLYQDAISLVTDASLPAIDQAELILFATDSMTAHLAPDVRAAVGTNTRDEQLPRLLGKQTYSRISRELAASLQDGPIDSFESVSSLSTLPERVQTAIIDRFIDLDLVQMADGGALTFGKNRKSAERLRTGAVETARMVHKIFSADVPTGVHGSLDDVVSTYELHDAETAVQSVHIESDTHRVKILPINELRLGHQDAKDGIILVRETIKLLQELSPEEKPNVILVTNLIQGEFAHLQSGRRASLAEGMDTNNAQFNAAHLLLDELRATGIPVVLSLGRDDHRIAKDNTVDVMKELRGIAKDGGKDNFIPYYQLNKIEEDVQFQKHLRFQLQYALPLSYALGRSLRSAEQVTSDTDGEVTTSEYLALYAYLEHGEPLPKELGIDPNKITGFGQWRSGMCVVDDVNIELDTDQQSTNIWYRHSISGFTPETLLQNHMGGLLGALGAMGTNGAEMPNVLMTGGSQEAVYATKNDSAAVSLPGLTNPNKSLGRSQFSTAVQGDPSRRMNLLRKRPSSPSISMYERRDTGEIVMSYINKDLMDRADSLPRMAIVELCDFQIGSPTARPDYQIKYLSYLIELAKEMPIAIQFAGDIIHGNIYPGFADESQSIGLLKIESQKQMVSGMLKKAFWTVPESLLNSFVDVLVQQGNHDEIQKKRTPNNHDNNIDYIIKDFEYILNRDGQPNRVRHNSIFRTETGVPVPTWMGRSEYGAYNILTAHYHIERGMKGDAGGLPVYHPYMRAIGLGEEERANILLGAHWHNPQSAILGNKLIVVGGAMAEQSQFEDMRGYSAKLAGTVTFIGGGKPLEVMSVTPEALNHHGVRHGWFTPENLADHGYVDDDEFDVRKHGPYSPDYLPKSGLQKALLALGREASQLVMFEAPQQGENKYTPEGQPLHLNNETARIFAVAAMKAATL